MKPLNCIVFEDNHIAQLALQAMINGIGHVCVNLYDSADDILAIIDETRPDIVMMDISLKGEKTGLEAVSELRSKTDIPVIFLSAYNDPQTVKKIESISNSRLIPKPYTAFDIENAISDYATRG